MNDMTNNFKAKRGLGAVTGQRLQRAQRGERAAGEAILPVKTVRSLGGPRTIDAWLRHTASATGEAAIMDAYGGNADMAANSIRNTAYARKMTPASPVPVVGATPAPVVGATPAPVVGATPAPAPAPLAPDLRIPESTPTATAPTEAPGMLQRAKNLGIRALGGSPAAATAPAAPPAPKGGIEVPPQIANANAAMKWGSTGGAMPNPGNVPAYTPASYMGQEAFKAASKVPGVVRLAGPAATALDAYGRSNVVRGVAGNTNASKLDVATAGAEQASEMAGGMAGAGLGASGAMTAGAPLIAASGPFAPVTATVLGLGGGVAGYYGGSKVAEGARKLGRWALGSDTTDASEKFAGPVPTAAAAAAAPVAQAAAAPVAQAAAAPIAQAAPVAPAAAAPAPAARPLDPRAMLAGGEVPSGTGAIRNLRTGAVTTIDSRLPEGAAPATTSTGRDSSAGLMTQAQPLMRSHNLNDIMVGRRLANYAQAKLGTEEQHYATDKTYQGNVMNRQIQLAQLQRELQEKNGKRVNDWMDDVFGPAQGKDGPNEARIGFQDRLTKYVREPRVDEETGEPLPGRTIGELTPEELSEFQMKDAAAQRAKSGSLVSIYKNLIDGHPDVADYNPERQVGRADGEAGKTNAFGFYRNKNGVLVYEPAVVNKNVITGTYDAPTKRSIRGAADAR